MTARSSINAPLSRHFDDLVAMGAHAYVLDRRVRQVLESIQIRAGGWGQVGQSAYVTERFLPPGERLVYRFHARQALHFGGHGVQRFASAAVPHTDRDFGERIEDIELGDSEAREPIHAHRIANDHRIEPAAAAWPSGGCAKFIPQLAESLGYGGRRVGGAGPVSPTPPIPLHPP